MHAGGLWLWWTPSTQWWYNIDALDLLIWHQSTVDPLTVNARSNLWESYRLVGWSSMLKQKRTLHLLNVYMALSYLIILKSLSWAPYSCCIDISILTIAEVVLFLFVSNIPICKHWHVFLVSNVPIWKHWHF